jgi:hypothetical protein
VAGLRNQKLKNRTEAQGESERDGDTTGFLIRGHTATERRSVIGFLVRIATTSVTHPGLLHHGDPVATTMYKFE